MTRFHTVLQLRGGAMQLALAGLASLFALARAQAQETVTLPAIDTGWYNDSGVHDPQNPNYIVGFDSGSPTTFANFSVFDLSFVDDPIAEATLRLLNPGPPNFGNNNGYDSPDPSETYELFDVTTNVDVLLGGTGGIAAFDDLGAGISFGSVQITPDDNGQIVEIDLNAAAIAALNNADGQFAFGGALTTISQDNVTQLVFGFSNPPENSVELRITTVPEPGALLLGGLAISALGFRRRSQRR